MKYGYDELYGVDLGEYLRRHGKSAEDLIKEIETDVEILEENLNGLRERYRNGEDDLEDLVIAVTKLIEKKRKHKNRILRWCSKKGRKQTKGAKNERT